MRRARLAKRTTTNTTRVVHRRCLNGQTMIVMTNWMVEMVAMMGWSRGTRARATIPDFRGVTAYSETVCLQRLRQRRKIWAKRLQQHPS